MILSKERGPCVNRNGTGNIQRQMKSNLTGGGVTSSLEGQRPSPYCNYGDIFPCDHPTTPMYREYAERLKTFQSWTNHNIIRPEVLAEAGLFFLGERDKCKCFYCNGGLQNWERGDNPMEEHAKYFPQCEYVLARKGPDFVAELNARFPNLSRPTIQTTPRQTNQESESFHQPSHNSAAMRRPVGGIQSQTPQTSSKSTLQIDPRKELASEAEKFGFDRRMIERLIDRKLERSGSLYGCLVDLIDDLISEERGGLLDSQPMEIVECSSIPDALPAVAADGVCSIQQSDCMQARNEPSNLQNQYQAAIDDTVCKLCHRNDRDCVFLDCGHICCCFHCGKNQKQCLICNSKVREIIKVFKM